VALVSLAAVAGVLAADMATSAMARAWQQQNGIQSAMQVTRSWCRRVRIGLFIVSPQFAMLVNQSVKFMPTGQGSLFMSITGASGHLVRETSIGGSGKVLQ
jgi:hypothetical protein